MNWYAFLGSFLGFRRSFSGFFLGAEPLEPKELLTLGAVVVATSNTACLLEH